MKQLERWKDRLEIGGGVIMGSLFAGVGSAWLWYLETIKGEPYEVDPELAELTNVAEMKQHILSVYRLLILETTVREADSAVQTAMFIKTLGIAMKELTMENWLAREVAGTYYYKKGN